MEPITIRIHEETKESLEEAADEYDVSVSEHIRNLIEKGCEYDELEGRLNAREERIKELEDQLRSRSEVEEKIEALPDRIRERGTYQERRRRLLDEASLAQRVKWKVTGVPVDRIDGDEGGED